MSRFIVFPEPMDDIAVYIGNRRLYRNICRLRKCEFKSAEAIALVRYSRKLTVLCDGIAELYRCAVLLHQERQLSLVVQDILQLVTYSYGHGVRCRSTLCQVRPRLKRSKRIAELLQPLNFTRQGTVIADEDLCTQLMTEGFRAGWLDQRDFAPAR